MRYVAKLLKQSNKDQFASIWRENYQKCWVTSQTFKTTQNYESHQITMNCIDLMSKTSNQRKTTKVILFRWIASIWCQNDQNIWVTQNYKSNQITMDCIDLTSKQSKMLSYVVKHSKLPKTTNVIKLQWTASIWHQNDLKCWDTSQNYKSDQIITNCIDLTSKRSKLLS